MAPLSYVIAAAANHRLCDRRRLSLKDLGEENFLLREEGSNTRRVTIEMLEQHRLRPARSQVMNSIETIKQSPMAGVGISLPPLHAILLELKTSSQPLLDTVVTPLRRDWYVVHSKRKQLCPAGNRLRTYLLNDAAAGLPSHFGVTETAEPKPIIP